MKNMKYVKSKGRFWNRDILEWALALDVVWIEGDQKSQRIDELLIGVFRGSGGVSPILVVNHQSSSSLYILTMSESTELYAVADCTSHKVYWPRAIYTESKLRSVCLIPMGLETPSVGPQIAECQKVLEKSGLEYKVGLPSDWYVLHADGIDAVSIHGLDELGLTRKRVWNKPRGPLG